MLRREEILLFPRWTVESQDGIVNMTDFCRAQHRWIEFFSTQPYWYTARLSLLAREKPFPSARFGQLGQQSTLGQRRPPKNRAGEASTLNQVRQAGVRHATCCFLGAALLLEKSTYCEVGTN